MGITDEGYAKALEAMWEERRRELDEDAKQKLQQVQQITSITATFPTTTAATVTAHPYNTKTGEPRMVASDLDHEAAKVSLETLKDMWVVRFQDNWVSQSDVKDDDFWRIAWVRLENVNKLERHMLFDRMEYVYRIIE